MDFEQRIDYANELKLTIAQCIDALKSDNYRSMQAAVKHLVKESYIDKVKLNSKKSVLADAITAFLNTQENVVLPTKVTVTVDKDAIISQLKAALSSGSYRELQRACKAAKDAGLTNVKCNSKKDVLISTAKGLV